MRLSGTPVRLDAYEAESLTSRRFRSQDLGALDRVYLPPSLRGWVDASPLESLDFLEDDNRGAVLPDSIATLDQLEFFLSVKGIGSTVQPYSREALDRDAIAPFVDDQDARARLGRPTPTEVDRIITGELWLRGSPYGGQGLEHATTALHTSERAVMTDLNGFRLAPVVKVCFLPRELEARLRRIYWYRRFPGRMVQELRLVPSNTRIYFHAKSTVGNDVRRVFDEFALRSDSQAVEFELRFVRTGLALLTLFARTLAHDPERDRYLGLDFHDVWLDKDAVLAPDGSIYFVDLEGVEEIALERGAVREKIEDQWYRSLYEFTFAFEQVESERRRRFGEGTSRREHFEALVSEALRDDRIVRPIPVDGGLELLVGNRLSEEPLYIRFPLVDR